MTTAIEELYDPALDSQPDPLAEVRMDQRIDRGNRELWSADDGIACRTHNTGTDPGSQGWGSCSRQAHPPHWKHIAAGGSNVCGIWGGDPDWTPPDQPPLDGMEPDPVEITPLEVGQLVKFRNRRDAMVVVGLRKANPGMPGAQGIEVLDLTHERYRVLRREQLVSRPVDAPPLTAQQTRWIAKHVAKARSDVRDIALRELRNGRFDEATLNRVLDELGLERYVPMYRGGGQLHFRYEIPQGAVSQADRERYSTRDAVQRQVRDKINQFLREHGVEIGVEVTDTYVDRPRLT